MGQTIKAEVEIQAPPEVVRSVFMDFSRYKEWAKWNFEPATLGKRPDDLKTGDKLKVGLGSMNFQPIVVANTPESFQWNGDIYPIFAGKHEFSFSPSTITPGGTTFTQREDFTGILSFLMAPGWSGNKSTLANWDRFNADLKMEVERSFQASKVV